MLDGVAQARPSSTSRCTASREVAKHQRYSASPITAKTTVVIVSERCRSSEPSICGETTTAIRRMVRLAETAREDESLARSSGSCVIAAASDP